MTRLLSVVVGTMVWLYAGGHGSGAPRRDERGLSQSTENAILLAAAVAIAGAVILAIGTYVKARLPK